MSDLTAIRHDDKESKNAVILVEDKYGQHEADKVLVDVALEGTEMEHNLGTLEAVRIYWKGVLCAIAISLTIIMRYYDIVIVQSFFALPAFQDAFGIEVPGHGKQVPARWQVALGNAALVGQVIGALTVSYPMEYFGRKKTLIYSLIATTILTFGQVFAPSIQVLTAIEYISGVVWGFYQVLIPTYSSEILPNVLRPYLAAEINICYAIAALYLNGVTAGFRPWTTEWGWRIPFALQWLWPVIILPILFFVPESPWYLVRKERLAEAEYALSRLSTPHPKIDRSKTLAMMQKTILYERKIEQDSTIWQCFKGSSWHRTEICIMIFFAQDFAGNATNTTYFFEQLNLSTTQAFDIAIGNSACGLVGTLSALFLLRYFGRRTAFISGVAACIVLELLVGFLVLPSNYHEDQGLAFGQVVLTFFFTYCFQLTLGPLCYTILTEVPSAKLRSKTVGFAIATDALCGIITSTVQPYLISPAEANIGAKVNFVWGGISIITLVWCIFRLPETKHRTVEELDYMFEHKVPTTKFKNYVMNEDDLKNNLAE